MKRMCAWIMAAVMLFALSPVLAEGGEAEHGIFTLLVRENDAMAWKGIAVPVADGIAMTAVTNLPTAPSLIFLTDGNTLWNTQEMIFLQGGRIVLLIFDAERAAPQTAPWSLTQENVPATAEELAGASLTVQTSDVEGSIIWRNVTGVGKLTWEDMDCAVLNLSGSALPGSPVVTESMELAGIILAEYAEGNNRYVALTMDAIRKLLLDTEVSRQQELTTAPEGYTVTADANRITFDWKDVQLDPPAEGLTRYLVVSDEKNDYLNYMPADQDTSCTMLLTPGRTYLSGLIDSPEAPKSLPAWAVVTELPEAEPLTDYGFQPVYTGLALREGTEQEPVYTPLDSVSAELLRAETVYFRSWSTYEISEKVEETLLITLTCPDGVNYRYASGWTYEPELGPKDEWTVTLADLGFLEALEGKGCPAGSYTIAFYVGGKIADSFVFELK